MGEQRKTKKKWHRGEDGKGNEEKVRGRDDAKEGRREMFVCGRRGIEGKIVGGLEGKRWSQGRREGGRS